MQAVLEAVKPTKKLGRPTKYVSGARVLLDAYLEGCKDSYDIKTGWHVRLPMVEGFALYLGVHRDTLNAWSKKYPEYEDVLERLKVEQYTRLINGGLAGHYKMWLVVRLLRRNHRHRSLTV